MQRLKLQILFACILIGVGAVILLFAHNVTGFWVAWLLIIGFYIGSLTTGEFSRVAVFVCTFATIGISLCLIGRTLPIHSLNWRGADRIQISSIDRSWQIEITDAKEIYGFTRFGDTGHYESMIRSGYGVHVYVTHDGHSRGYYVHGNAIGDRPGGFSQSVFVPQEDGFLDYLESIINQHGHGEIRP